MVLSFGIFVLLAFVVLGAFFLWSALRAKRDRQVIDQCFFHDFPDALMDVPKNQVRDGQRGARLEPTLAMHHISVDTKRETHTLNLSTPDTPEPEEEPEEEVFVLPGKLEIAEEHAILSSDVTQEPVVLHEASPEPALVAKDATLEPFLEDFHLTILDPNQYPFETTGLNPTLDFIANIGFDRPSQLAHLPCFTTLRHYTLVGYAGEEKAWKIIHTLSDAPYQALKIALQMVDRNGAISRQELEKFCEEAKVFAHDISGHITLPALTEPLQTAQALDRFCAEVDVLVNVHVQLHQAISGAALYKVLAQAGLTLKPDGIFHYLSQMGESLYTVFDDAVSFDQQRLDAIHTSLITWLFDVPRVAGGIAVFDQGLAIAQKIAGQFEGDLVDDNQHLLTEQGIQRIREQLVQIYQQMEAKGIKPGSSLSNRLFI